tara:strand:+ start:85 stop:198 length:114 start_codon:yes stop_codon:yes gene_type:complete
MQRLLENNWYYSRFKLKKGRLSIILDKTPFEILYIIN